MDDELLDNGMASLMRRKRPPRPTGTRSGAPATAPPPPPAPTEPTPAPPPPLENGPDAAESLGGGARSVPPTSPSALGYVRNGVVLTTSGRKRRMTMNLTEGVALTLKAAAANHDVHGTTVNAIIEALALQAGYYPGGPRDPAVRRV